MAILKAFNEYESVEVISDPTKARASTHASLAISGVNRAALAIDSNAGAAAYAEAAIPDAAELWSHFLFKGAVSTGESGYLVQLRDEDDAPVFELYATDESNLHIRFDGTNEENIGPPSTVRAIDVHTILHATTGVIEVFVDATLVWSFSGDTLGARTSTMLKALRWRSLDTTATAGDTYATILSQVLFATTNTTRKQVYTLSLSTHSGTTEWAGSVSDINGATLNETTTMTADTVGQTSTFTHSALAALDPGESIDAVIIATRADYETGAAVTTQAGIIRVSTTNYESAVAQPLADGVMTPAQHVFSQNPATSLAWTESDISTASFGFRAKA